jgi:hypothetical protein
VTILFLYLFQRPVALREAVVSVGYHFHSLINHRLQKKLVALCGPALNSAFCELVNPSFQQQRETIARQKATVVAVVVVSDSAWCSWSVGKEGK